MWFITAIKNCLKEHKNSSSPQEAGLLGNRIILTLGEVLPKSATLNRWVGVPLQQPSNFLMARGKKGEIEYQYFILIVNGECVIFIIGIAVLSEARRLTAVTGERPLSIMSLPIYDKQKLFNSQFKK